MQVALIVGAIRTIVETSYEPQVVLEALNRRLCNRSKRSQSYATCVALHISADGKSNHCQRRTPGAVSERQRDWR